MSLNVALVFDSREDYAKLGYTSEQIAEFDVPETIDAIAAVMLECGYRVDRVGHIQELVSQLAQGKRWDIVFNIAEGMHGIAREAQVPALLEAYDIPYTFSPPEALILCHQKAWAKQQVRQAGLLTADWALITSPDDIVDNQFTYPLFCKPVAEGTGKGISARSLVNNQAELMSQCVTLLQCYPQGVIAEPYLTGREFTVGLLGTGPMMKAIGVLEVKLKAQAEPGGHTYHNKAYWETCVDYPLAADPVAMQAQALALGSARALGCRDACRVDIRCDSQQRPHFLEVNPLPGLNPTFSDMSLLAQRVNLPYQEMISTILHSALQRYPHLSTKAVAQV